MQADRVLQETPLEDILKVVGHDRSKGKELVIPSSAEMDGEQTTQIAFTTFTKLTQSRVLSLADVAARCQVIKSRNTVAVLQASAVFVLDQVWDPTDTALHELIAQQANMHLLLGESLVNELADLCSQKIRVDRRRRQARRLRVCPERQP